MFCSGCGRGIEMGEGLLRTVSEFPLSVGPLAGKTIKEAGADPEILQKWARRSATKGPAQMRLLRAYAKALAAHQELLLAAQVANVFPTMEGPATPRARLGPPGPTGDTGGSSEPPGTGFGLHPVEFVSEMGRSCVRGLLSGKRCVLSFCTMVAAAFPVRSWIRYFAKDGYKTVSAFAPVLTTICMWVLAYPRQAGIS